MALSTAQRLSVNLCRIRLNPAPSNGLRCLATLAGGRIPADRNTSRCLAEPHRVSPRRTVCKPSLPLLLTSRSTNFFNKVSADQLWKGVTSVSNAGRKQGRARRVGSAKNLNRGQIIGVGKENMVWPGLNAPIIRGRELVKQQKLPQDLEREKKMLEMRDSMKFGMSRRTDPLERGWSGHSFGGKSIGPPDNIGTVVEGASHPQKLGVVLLECTEAPLQHLQPSYKKIISLRVEAEKGSDNFEGFNTKVLEFKLVVCMTKIFGRKRRYSMFAVTGNGNGTAGFALAKATSVPAVIRKVKNMAGQKLMYIELCNNHTVLHDFFTQFGATKIFVKKAPEGYGLVCHRAIRTICEAIGIKNIYAKVEGAVNVQNLTKAFFIGLINQRSYQDLANEKRLHLVEFRNENFNFPTVIASPQSTKVRTKSEIPNSEELDFTLHVMQGKVPLKRKVYPPGYESLPSYQMYLKKFAKRRNQEKVRVAMKVEHGECRSFYTDEYPECRPGPERKALEESI